MNEGIITARYTKALYQTGEEEAKSQDVFKDILLIENIIKENPEFMEFLASPIVKVSDKKNLFKDLFEDNIGQLSYNFLLLLLENKRELFLPSICRFYVQIYKENQGIQEGSITTAKPLNKEHKEEIHKFIRRRFKIEIELDEKIDPSLIGGFLLRIEDQQIDASISSQLKKIKTQLINT